MTILRYVALGIACVGFSYSLYTNRTQNETIPAQPRTVDSNVSTSVVQNYADISFPQFLDFKHKTEKEVAAAQPQRTWYGITLGYVVTDTPENIQRYEGLEDTLDHVNGEYIKHCESF